MRHYLTAAMLMICINVNSYAQFFTLPERNYDSLLSLPESSFRDRNSINTLLDASQRVMYENVHQATQLSIKALESAQHIDYANGKAYAFSLLGEALTMSGNFAKGIETALKAIPEAEKAKDTFYTGKAYIKVAQTYVNFGDYAEAIKYHRKVISVAGPGEVIFGVMGDAFVQMDMLDSALDYSQKAYQLDLKSREHWSLPYRNLGEIHLKLKKYAIALEYFKTILSLKVFKLDSVNAQAGIARTYYALNQNDSALWYARQSIARMQSSHEYSQGLASMYALVKDIYKDESKLDSAFLYQELMLAVKDSIFAAAKINQIQNLKFNQQLKELEMEQSNRENIKNRRNNLQLGAIAIGLITFVVLFFSLSTSFIVKERFVSFFGIIALLLVFEFINLFIHPFIGHFTDHSPLLMFLVMVCIAALLVPAHHRLEDWITHQLVEKNKKVRLAAARKTIKDLGG